MPWWTVWNPVLNIALGPEDKIFTCHALPYHSMLLRDDTSLKISPPPTISSFCPFLALPGTQWRWPKAESQNSFGQEPCLLCQFWGWIYIQRCAFPGCCKIKMLLSIHFYNVLIASVFLFIYLQVALLSCLSSKGVQGCICLFVYLDIGDPKWLTSIFPLPF